MSPKFTVIAFLFWASSLIAQITDGSFELGTFNSAMRSGRDIVFIADASQAYEGSSFGAIQAVATSSGPLRTVNSFDVGRVEPGCDYVFSFYAKKPSTNGFESLRVSASGGVFGSALTWTSTEAPSALNLDWVAHSYYVSIPASWNTENQLRITLSAAPISPVVSGQTYSFHLDSLTLTLIGATPVPEPQAAAIGAGIVALFFCSTRRRRKSF